MLIIDWRIISDIYRIRVNKYATEFSHVSRLTDINLNWLISNVKRNDSRVHK